MSTSARKFVCRLPEPGIDGRARDHLGTPHRARACECPGVWLGDDDTCLRCGRLLADVIQRTWRRKRQRS